MDLPGWFSYDEAGTEYPMAIPAHDKVVGSWCEAVYDEAKEELERCEEIVNLDRHIKYLMGKQWVERRPSYKAAPVANRLWTNLVQLVSYLTDIRQSFEVKANQRRYDKHAEILNNLIKAWIVNEDVDMTLAMIIIHAALTIGYGRLVWNSEAKNGAGELELSACGAMDVIPIRPGHNIQKALGVIYRTPKPLSWFRDRYQIKGIIVPADKEYSQFVSSSPSAGQGMWGRAMSALSPQMRRLFGQASSMYKDSAIPMALYREFWIRDTQKNTSDATVFVGDPNKEFGYKVGPGQKLYPRGRLICMGGPVVLYDGPNPFYHGMFPFAALRLNRVPWQWPGISEFRNQIPLQDIMNNILAGIMDAVKKAVNPPLISPDNAFGDSIKRSLDPNMPGAKVYYSPAAITPPQYAPSPQLPSFVFQTMLYAQQEMDHQSGFIDPGALSRRGIIPAADTLEQMKEGQQTLVRLKGRYIESFLKEIGQQFIPNTFQFYTLSRRIQVLGQEGITFDDFDWNPGTMIPADSSAEHHWRQFQFLIQPGTLMKSARVQEQMLFLNLRRQGDMDRKNMFKALDLEGLEESVKRNLEIEGKEVLINVIRQKMAATGGGGGISPEILKGLDASPAGGGAH